MNLIKYAEKNLEREGRRFKCPVCGDTIHVDQDGFSCNSDLDGGCTIDGKTSEELERYVKGGYILNYWHAIEPGLMQFIDRNGTKHDKKDLEKTINAVNKIIDSLEGEQGG